MTDKSAGEALPANADRIHSALIAARSALREQADHKSARTNDEVVRRVTNGFIADQLSHVLDDYEVLRASPQPSEPAAREFFRKHGLGSLSAPSCFGCGAAWVSWDGTTRHLELPDIYLCAKCVAAIRPAAPVAAGSDCLCHWCECARAGGGDGLNDAWLRIYASHNQGRSPVARTTHPEPAAAEPVYRNPFAWLVEGPKGWLLHVRGEKATEEWWRILNNKGAIALYRETAEDHPAFASAPSQPSEGPARVTDAMVEALRDSLWSTWGNGRQTTDWPSWNDMRAALEAALAAAEGKSNG